MKVKKIIISFRGVFTENCYVITNNTDECIVIDPGRMSDELKDYIKDYRKVYYLITHGHFDHIGGLQDKKYEIMISEIDKSLIPNNENNGAVLFGKRNIDFTKLEYKCLHDNEIINLLNLKIECIACPGHTKGSMSFRVNNAIFTGDTLFYDSIGRTDLFSGNYNDIQKSIKKLVNICSNDIMVYPGHGENAKLKEIKKINFYIS